MLIITEKDIDNRKDSINAMEQYYSRQMEIKKIPQKYRNSLKNSCNILIESLNNIKKSLLYMSILDEEQNGTFIKNTKKEIEKIFFSSDTHRKELISNVRDILFSA